MPEFDENAEQLKSFFYALVNRKNIPGAEINSFFEQAEQCMMHRLYLAAMLCFFNGIEASLRFTHKGFDANGKIQDPGDDFLMKTYNLKVASDFGMPVHLLAFPDESDFMAKVNSTSKDNQRGLGWVKLHALRNNISHGNVFEFVELNDDVQKFDAKKLQHEAEQLRVISQKWLEGLRAFRHKIERRKMYRFSCLKFKQHRRLG